LPESRTFGTARDVVRQLSTIMSSIFGNFFL
jgi:hypothetical protein